MDDKDAEVFDEIQTAAGDVKPAMMSVELDDEEIPATDITFECPHCAKSLSIDPRGAGLTIPCPHCENPVTVPIPEGMEIDDFDATPEELSMQLARARQNLMRAQGQLADMAAELAELRDFKAEAELDAQAHAIEQGRMRDIVSDAIRRQNELLEQLREVADMLSEPEQGQ